MTFTSTDKIPTQYVATSHKYIMTTKQTKSQLAFTIS